jgi:hypothetical protein
MWVLRLSMVVVQRCRNKGIIMKTYVHIVIGRISYEGEDVVGVFTSKNKAEQFKKKCCDYNNTKKSELVPLNIPDKDWKTMVLEHRKWVDAHPAGGAHDTYNILKAELK